MNCQITIANVGRVILVVGGAILLALGIYYVIPKSNMISIIPLPIKPIEEPETAKGFICALLGILSVVFGILGEKVRKISLFNF